MDLMVSTMNSKRNSGPNRKSRFHPLVGKVIHLLLLGGPLLNIHGILESLPSVMQLVLIAFLGISLLRILVRFARWNDEMVYLRQFVRAVVFLLAVVLLENFCTWYVL
jgi:hypothetical protein